MKPIGIFLTAAAIISAVAVSGGIVSSAFAATGGPTVVLSSTTGSSTNAASIPVTATFSEAVNGLASTSVQATNATVSAISGSGVSYSFTLTPLAQGSTTVMIPADVATSTASSTGNQASNLLTFISDTTAPVITEVTGIATTTASSSPSYTFSSTEAGTVGLTGGCTSTTTTAVSGSNMLTFNALANGTYACSLGVTDAAGNASNSLPINFTVNAPATTTPIISNLAVNAIGTTTATVSWTTDANSTSQVFYGTSASYGSSTTLNTTATTTHSVALANLAEATLYHVQAVSTNSAGTATSSDMVFVTQLTSSTTPLAVTGIDTVRGNAIADGTFGNGWQWTLHFVIPDIENFFAMRFNDFFSASSSSTIPVANNIRIFSPQSSNASTTASAIVATGNGYGPMLMLNGDTATTTPGRQIDLTVQMAVPAGTPTGTYSTTFGAQSTTTATTTP